MAWHPFSYPSPIHPLIYMDHTLYAIHRSNILSCPILLCVNLSIFFSRNNYPPLPSLVQFTSPFVSHKYRFFPAHQIPMSSSPTREKKIYVRIEIQLVTFWKLIRLSHFNASAKNICQYKIVHLHLLNSWLLQTKKCLLLVVLPKFMINLPKIKYYIFLTISYRFF